MVKKAAEAAGARFAVSKHWELGGEGAEELAQVVIEAAEEKPHFKFLYADDEPLKSKIEKIATQVYGADGVTYSPVANQKIKRVEAEKVKSEKLRAGVSSVELNQLEKVFKFLGMVED